MKFRKISSIFLSIALFAVLPLYQALAKGVVNQPQYTYTEAICTKGRTEQKQLCQSLSAEALVFRLNKGFTNQAPDANFYAKWVRKLVNQKTNPQELADLLATQNPSTQSTSTQIGSLYNYLQCKNPSQMTTAINQWAGQVDAGKQTRAKIALYLAKKRESTSCLDTSWRNFIDTIADVNLNSTDDPEPTLQDVSLSCEVASGANSCTTTAPQYCVNTLSVQPTHGTSVISGSTMTYTRSGSATTTENYAHLRQNGSATAKCNVTVTFAVPVNTLQDASATCNVNYNPSNQVNQCVVQAPEYCQASLVTQPAHGVSTISGGNVIYQMTGSSTAEENYAHLRQNGNNTAKCNIKITFTTSGTGDTDNSRKFHVAIIGAGYADAAAFAPFAVQSQLGIQQALDAAGYGGSVVFHTISTPDNLGCFQLGTRNAKCADDNGARIRSFLASQSIPADRVQITLNLPGVFAGGADREGGTYSVVASGTIEAPWYHYDAYTHEFAHTLGLQDEYVETYTDNEGKVHTLQWDRVGSISGQCTLYPPGNWPNVPADWQLGCYYTDLYRPSADSIMRSANSHTFNDVSKEVMKEHVKGILGY